MNYEKKRKIAVSAIVLGAILGLAAFGLYMRNYAYDANAGSQAQALLEDLAEGAGWELPSWEEIERHEAPARPVGAVGPAGPEATPIDLIEVFLDVDASGDGSGDGPDGSPGSGRPASYSVIGTLSFPDSRIRLPVIGEYSESLLGISCCRLSGYANDKPSRLVVAGHNIRSHFTLLNSFELGGEVAFTTINGETYYYEAVAIADLHKTEGAKLLEPEGWDLCLFTCKSNRVRRTVVYFAEIAP